MDPGLVSGIYISIHAPRGGNDTPLRVHGRIQQYFNPRSPHGERPQSSTLRPRRTLISIHAPRMGSDLLPLALQLWRLYFNPRSPHGERLAPDWTWLEWSRFQSTLPAWGATEDIDKRIAELIFQSTLPAWGAT